MSYFKTFSPENKTASKCNLSSLIDLVCNHFDVSKIDNFHRALLFNLRE